MADNNRNRRNNSNQFKDDWNKNQRYNEQYRGRDPRYDDENISGSRKDYNKVNYMPDNDENRSFDQPDYENSNYSTSGTYGDKGDNDNDNDNNRKMDRHSGNRKMRTNYGNNYQDWGGYNEDNRRGRNRFSNMGTNMGNNDFDGSRNGGYSSNDQFTHRDSRRHEDQEHKQQRDLWDRSHDEVSSWFGDTDAERRREMDKTMGEHRGKGPRGYQRSEQRIHEDICDRLTEDHRVDATDIEVKVQGSEVVLSGNVHSREEKRRAEDLVESIPGVKNVENRIHVNRSDNSGSQKTRDSETGTRNRNEENASNCNNKK